MPEPPPPSASPPPASTSPLELLASRRYVALLVVGAAIGVPVAAAAYLFLGLIDRTQQYVFTTLPADLGFDGAPVWWPVAPLVVAGLLVGLVIRHLPGEAGHEPAAGFEPAGAVRPIDLPGIVLASFTTLALGVVLGPEAPLIAIGSGLGVLALTLVARDAPAQAVTVVGAAASFAAISTLLGSPLTAAFLLMEAAGIGGPMLGVVLMPGLLAAGVGYLIYVGLDQLTGLGTFSLAIGDIPSVGAPTVSTFLWAIVIGIAAALVGGGIRRVALLLQPVVARRRVALTPVLGLTIGLLAIVFAETSGRSPGEVLFSGQSALPSLLTNASGWTAGALVLVVVCKGLAYAVAMSGFRGGPVFPAMFIGAAGGMALAHLPGLPTITGAAMGIGAMAVVMLGLPLTSVLLTAAFLAADAVDLTPLVIVSVVVAHVANARLQRLVGRPTRKPGAAVAAATEHAASKPAG